MVKVSSCVNPLLSFVPNCQNPSPAMPDVVRAVFCHPERTEQCPLEEGTPSSKVPSLISAQVVSYNIVGHIQAYILQSSTVSPRTYIVLRGKKSMYRQS